MTAESPRHLLVQHGAFADRAELWVGVVDDPVGALRVGVGPTELEMPPTWDAFQAAGRTFRAQRIVVPGLPAASRLPARLSDGARVLATAGVSTLPTRLPTPVEPPFTVLLGSCFAVAQDPHGTVGATLARLPAASRPAVTILGGDQVYLDSPALHYLAHAHRPDELAGELLAQYVATWSQEAPLGGFRRVLASGASVFTSDDHDFWNNAPNIAPYARDTWTAGGRQAWLAAATRLLGLFQARQPGDRLAVGPLSFYVADTRRSRAADRSILMPPDQLTDLAGWVAGLSGPGVLVVGQPIFIGPTGWKGNLSDWGMADYRQYADLVRILAATPHDLLVLTGDVHFGRVASCRLPSGRRIVELIASPLALISPLAGGKWKPAPPLFPATPLPGVTQVGVTTETYARADNHFMTIAFAAAGPAVHANVLAWAISGTGPTVPRAVHATELH